MLSVKPLAVAVTAFLAAAPAWAQSGPAELPPADFSGRQFVDSTGCSFVRSGLDGTVSWVPRLNSERQPICGEIPTFAAAAPAPAPEPVAEPVPLVAEAAPPAPRPAPRPAPKVAPPRVTAQVGGVPVAQIRRPPPTVQRVEAVLAATCPRLGPSAHRYLVVIDGLPVRCPTPAVGLSAPSIPKGYKAAWEDGRLNPHRGPRTGEGDAQMARVLDVTKVPMPAAPPAER